MKELQTPFEVGDLPVRNFRYEKSGQTSMTGTALLRQVQIRAETVYVERLY
jgi:hypothetical protein